jgi:hypothetical protein
MATTIARWLARKTDPVLRRLAGNDEHVLVNLRILSAAVALLLLGLSGWGVYVLACARRPSALRNEQIAPAGPVIIVNRDTAHIFGATAWRIEPTGAYHRLRTQRKSGEPGRYVALADWAKKGEAAIDPNGRPRQLLRWGVPNPENAALWKFTPGGDGFWVITSQETGKCLAAPGHNSTSSIARLTPFQAGDPLQEWRLEAPTGSKDGAPKSDKGSDAQKQEQSERESAPTAEDSGGRAAPDDAGQHPAAETPTVSETNQKLDASRLAVGDTGRLACAYVEILNIIDDRASLVLPYVLVQRDEYGRWGEQTAIHVEQVPQLPILLKEWATAGKVTGQKEDVSDKVFHVTGTEDVKKTNGSVIRVHVLEVVGSPSK